MNLRRALKCDTETLFDIRCSVLENHQSREELATLGITSDSISAMVESEDYISLVAEVEGRPAGFAMTQISEAYVFAVFVRPEFEGQGIGKALMRVTEQGLRRAGVIEAWLSTGADPRLRAVGFYRHLGWREEGHLEDGQIIFKKKLDNVEQSSK